VEKLRNFRFRLSSSQFPAGATQPMAHLAAETIVRIKSALDDDLNTAEAQAALFDMLRKANTALDAAEVRHDDVKPLLGALEKFDEIFGVLKDDDQPKMKVILDWARAEGREKEISPELMEIAGSAQLADEQAGRNGSRKKVAKFQSIRCPTRRTDSCRCHRREHKGRGTLAQKVAPASCRLSRGRLALGAAGEDARRTAAGTALQSKES